MSTQRWHSPALVRASIALHVLAALAVIASPRYWPWVLAAIVLDHWVIVAAGLWPRSQWLGTNWIALPAAAKARGEIALTIDDGPDPAVTPQVLDILERHGARATFFCIGSRAARHPDLCREIVRRGHCVENHSERHSHDFALLGPSRVMAELNASQQTIAAITGERPRFFRAPAGLRNLFLNPALGRLDLTLASWSARGFDTRIGDAARVKGALIAGLQPGAILLLHDGNAARTDRGVPVVLDVLPAVLESAAVRGLRPVTLRQAAE
jgi:peptidoglycan/xylan/chitin deacetylase (PgdA/CDA1 family)